jgi:hypothetical protein
VALDVLLLAGVAWPMRDDVLARRRAATLLAAANAQLEAKVRERTARTFRRERALDRGEVRAPLGPSSHGAPSCVYRQLIANSLSDLVLVVTKALNISRVERGRGAPHGQRARRPDRPPPVELRAARRPASRRSTHRPGPAGGDATCATSRRGSSTSWGAPPRLTCTIFPVRDGDKVVGGVVILEVGQA